MKIAVRDLRQLSNILFDYLESQGFDEIEYDVDYFWKINRDEQYNLERKPAEFGLGQLSDDWDDLKGILYGERKPLGFAFVQLGPLLKAIGDTIISW